MKGSEGANPDPAAAWREHERSQLQFFAALSLRAKLAAVEGMADVLRKFEQLRRDGKLRSR